MYRQREVYDLNLNDFLNYSEWYEDTLLKETLEDIASAITRLTHQLVKQSSIRRESAAGLITGAGTAIDASVIAASVLLVLAKMLGWFGVYLPTR